MESIIKRSEITNLGFNKKLIDEWLPDPDKTYIDDQLVYYWDRALIEELMQDPDLLAAIEAERIKCEAAKKRRKQQIEKLLSDMELRADNVPIDTLDADALLAAAIAEHNKNCTLPTLLIDPKRIRADRNADEYEGRIVLNYFLNRPEYSLKNIKDFPNVGVIEGYFIFKYYFYLRIAKLFPQWEWACRNAAGLVKRSFPEGYEPEWVE